MLKTLKLHLSQNKVLLIATLISLLLHTLLLSNFKLTLPLPVEGRKTLDLHLVNLQAVQKISTQTVSNLIPPPRSLPEMDAEKNTESKNIKIKPNDFSFNETEPALAEPVNIEPVNVKPEEVLASLPTLGKVTPENSNSNFSEAQSIISESATSLGDLEKKPSPLIYQHVESEFEITRGGNSPLAGKTRITFILDKNGTYKLNSITEATGISSLFGTLIQSSEGSVTEKGLVPSYFSYQNGSEQINFQSARFLWSDGILQMASERGELTEQLSLGTQDFLSFMYQFMFEPPLDITQITMTNGKLLRTYSYNFQSEDLINTKMGLLKTMHLLITGDEDEKTELWLGIDYQNLPVKIRKTEKDGAVIEQIIVNIFSTLP